MLKALRSREGLGPSIVRSFVGTAGIRIVGMGLAFLVGVQLAQTLGPEGYGIYGLVISIVALLLVPTQFGLPQLATRELAAAEERHEPGVAREFLRWSTKIVVAIGLLVTSGSLVLVHLMDVETPHFVATMLWGLMLIPVVSLLSVWGGALRGLSHVNLGQLPDVILRPGFFSLALALMVVFAPQLTNPASAMALHVGTATLSAVFAGFWLLGRLPIPAPASSGFSVRRRIWPVAAFPMAVTEGARMVQGHAAVLLLGLLGAATMVGLLKVAASVAVAVAIPIALANVAAAPFMARLFAASDRERLRRLCAGAARVMTLGIVALALPFFLAGDSLIAYVFGEAFRPAHGPLLVLLLGHCASAVMGPSASLLNMANQERRVTRGFLYALSVNLGLALVLIPLLGTLGAALAIAIGMVVLHVVLWADARRLLRIDTSVFGSKITAAIA